MSITIKVLWSCVPFRTFKWRQYQLLFYCIVFYGFIQCLFSVRLIFHDCSLPSHVTSFLICRPNPCIGNLEFKPPLNNTKCRIGLILNLNYGKQHDSSWSICYNLLRFRPTLWQRQTKKRRIKRDLLELLNNVNSQLELDQNGKKSSYLLIKWLLMSLDTDVNIAAKLILSTQIWQQRHQVKERLKHQQNERV